MMGRPAKPLKLHELQGTEPGAALEVPSEHVAGRPHFPAHLSRDARRAMKRLCADLEARRALTPGDRELLATYGVIYERWLRATNALAAEGEVVDFISRDKDGELITRRKPNPWLPIAQASEKQMFQILQQLGLTPLLREKVKPAAEPPKSPELIPFTAAWYRAGKGDESDENKNG